MISLLARLLGRRAQAPLRGARWVVVDCETSGLDTMHDRLLAVGAVAVRGGRIELAESFSAVLRQEQASDPANILIHGISGEAQLAGRPVGDVLREFSAYLADGLPVAYHAPFDDAFLRRAMATQPGIQAPRHWLDLARLAPALYPGPDRARRALDDWLAEFGIGCAQRHEALADAYATAQLLLVLLAEAERQGADTVERLRRLERRGLEHSGRWLGGG